MRPALGRVARSARSLRSLHTTPAAAAPQLLVAALPVAPQLPQGAGERAPSSPSTSQSLSAAGAASGMSLQQAFAAHSLAQLGSDTTDSFGQAEDEVVALMHKHLAAVFGAGQEVARSAHTRVAGPPASMCGHQPTFQDAPGSSRAAAQQVSQRLSKQMSCPLEPGTPYTLQGALQPSSQARLVVEAAAPFRVCWASPQWESLAGQKLEAVAGQPCLRIVQGPSRNAGRMQALTKALQAHARGATELEYLVTGEPDTVPVRCTATPLIGRDGSSTHMLLAFNPLKAGATTH